MKKKISSLLIFSLLFTSLFTVSTTTAVHASIYEEITFTDVAYSNSLEIYVAVGNNKSDKGCIFVSYTGYQWEQVASLDRPITAFGISNRCLVWWEEESAFVLRAGIHNSTSYLYKSYDGFNWIMVGQTLTASNISVGNGKLLVGGGGKIRVHTSLSNPIVESDYIEYQLPSSSGQYIKFAELSDGEANNYIAATDWIRWKKIGDEDFAIRYVTLSYRDIDFSTALDKWIVVAGSNNITTISTTDVQTNFSPILLSDGTESQAKLNALGISQNYIIVGSETGDVYVAPNDSTLSNNTVWTIATNGKLTEKMTQKVVSIAPITEDDFLLATTSKLYIVNKTESGFIYNDVDAYEFRTTGPMRVEIPAATQDVAVYEYKTQVLDPLGNPDVDPIVSFEPITALPNGVEFLDGDTANEPNTINKILKVENTTPDSATLTIRAISQSGRTKDFIIRFIKEASIVIEGDFDVAIPAYGEPSENYTYTAIVLGSDGLPMDRTATITVDSPMLENTTFDVETSTLTLNDNSESGTITLKAVSDTTANIVATEIITVKPRVPTVVEFLETHETIMVPDKASITIQYKAQIKDQTNKPMPQKSIQWSVRNKDGSDNLTGVSINEQTGALTIYSKAYNYTLVVIAASAEVPSVYAESECSLMFTNKRIVLEDQKNLTIPGDLNNVVSDLELATEGVYGSTITWSTDNENIVSRTGKVTRAQESDKKVTLTATIQKEKEKLTKDFIINVLKLDNILLNGDFETGELSPWKSVSGAKLDVDSNNKNSGLFGLSVMERQRPSDGVYQTVTLKNNSTYAFEGYVKSLEEDIQISITSKKAGYPNIATVKADANKFTRIAGTFSYTNLSKTFEDDIEISTRFSNSTAAFYIDDFKIFEITKELDRVILAIQNAEYLKTQTAIDKAKLEIHSFYDLPIKEELLNRVNAIKVKSSNNNSGGGSGSSGGGGGRTFSGGGAVITTPPSNSVKPNYTELVEHHLLIFKDLKDHWAKDDVEYMANLGFVSGREEEMFVPEDRITRAEFAVLITKTMGLEAKKYENSFYDIISEDWYSDYVQAARDAGYIMGSNGLFRPNDPITREEMTKIIVEAYNKKLNKTLETGGALYYGDIHDISSWAYDYIVTAVDLGLVKGVSEFSFAPKQFSTRAQAVVILRRLYEKTITE